MSNSRCIIISLMSGSPWGGSEELWYKIAEYAVEDKRRVTISIKKWSTRNNKIDILENAGVRIVERDENSKKSFFLRIFIKLITKFIGPIKLKTWDWLDTDHEGSILINLGGPDDFLGYPELIEHLKSKKINYSIIQQFNFEHNVYNSINRKRVREFYQGAQNSYFVSQRNLDTTQRSICQKLDNSYVVSNPANLNCTEYIEFPEFCDGVVYFACVARLDCMYKAQDILLTMLSNEKWKKRKWILNFYGTGNDLDYISELIDLYSLGAKVRLNGHVKSIENIWRNNHMLILPSVAEGTPLSLIEAMVCGRPSVVTDVGGNAHLVTEGINGFISPNSSVNQLDLTLERAWESIGYWKDLGIAARNTALAKIDFESYKMIYDNEFKN
jgi:glycosyltransferase involved in cell wall biosynthesis